MQFALSGSDGPAKQSFIPSQTAIETQGGGECNKDKTQAGKPIYSYACFPCFIEQPIGNGFSRKL